MQFVSNKLRYLINFGIFVKIIEMLDFVYLFCNSQNLKESLVYLRCLPAQQFRLMSRSALRSRK